MNIEILKSGPDPVIRITGGAGIDPSRHDGHKLSDWYALLAAINNTAPRGGPGKRPVR